MTEQVNTSTKKKAEPEVKPPPEEKKVICSTCRIQFLNLEHYKWHLTTEFHQYNTKRRMANMDPITEEVFEQKRVCKRSMLLIDI
jgi:hypothetical protein